MRKSKLAVILALSATAMTWPFQPIVAVQPVVETSLLPAATPAPSAVRDHGRWFKKREVETDDHVADIFSKVISKIIEVRADTTTTDTSTTTTSTSTSATTTSETTSTSTTTSSTTTSTSETTTGSSTTTSATASATASTTTTASTASSTSTTTTSSSTTTKSASTTISSASATSSISAELKEFNREGEIRAIAVFGSIGGIAAGFIIWHYIKKRKLQAKAKANRLSETGSMGSTSQLYGKDLSPEDKQRYRASMMFMDNRSQSPRSDSRRNSRSLLVVAPTETRSNDIALEPMRTNHSAGV